MVGRRKRAGYALVDFTLVSLRLQPSSLSLGLTSPHSKPAHCACKLDCPRRHDLIQLFENLISRNAVVVNTRCTNVTSVSAAAARCRELTSFFACDLGVKSIEQFRYVFQNDMRGLFDLPSIPIFSGDDDDAAVLFTDDYAIGNQNPFHAERGLGELTRSLRCVGSRS